MDWLRGVRRSRASAPAPGDPSCCELALKFPQSSKLASLVHCRGPGYEGGRKRSHVGGKEGEVRLEHFLGLRTSASKSVS